MRPPMGAYVALIMSAVFGVAGVLVMALVPGHVAAIRWGLGGGLVMLALANLAFLPRLWREQIPKTAAFHPLVNGQPVVGSAAVWHLAMAAERALAGAPYVVLSAPNAVRLVCNCGPVYGTDGIVWAHSRFTLAAGPDPRTMICHQSQWESSTPPRPEHLTGGSVNQHERYPNEPAYRPSALHRLGDSAIRQAAKENGITVKASSTSRVVVVNALGCVVLALVAGAAVWIQQVLGS